jgi:predicted house-cleaning NTP pyrophosphatase (Maf/HAM1 superfamily)
MNKIILASQSPRRNNYWNGQRYLLKFFKETSKDYPPGLEPGEVAVYIAHKKL